MKHIPIFFGGNNQILECLSPRLKIIDKSDFGNYSGHQVFMYS